MTSHAATHRRSAAARSAATLAEASRPQPQGLVRRTVRLTADVWRKADRDRILGLAAENAFMGMLTVFPTLLVFAAVLGQIQLVVGSANTEKVKQSVIDFFTRVLNGSAGGVNDTVQGLFQPSGKALTLALVIALASVAQAFASVLNTVTVAYELQDHRGWWRRRFLGLLLGIGSLLAGAVIVTAFVIGPFFGHAEQVVAKVGLSHQYAFVWAWIRYPVGVVALIGWATTLFHVCPDRPGRWREGLPGGLLTALLWIGTSLAFSVYLGFVVPRSPVLGALGGGLLLMTWFYLLFLSLLGGAELNATLLARKRSEAAARHPAGTALEDPATR